MNYYSDNAIESIKQDKLNRRNFAKNLAQTIIDFKVKDTFTIGLFGEWGTGKTSLINMTLEEIDAQKKKNDDEIIVCKFDPWHFDSSTQLISQFLIWLGNIFESKAQKISKEIGQALIKYSTAFELANLIPVPAVGSIVSKIGQVVSKGLGNCLAKKNESKDILKQKDLVIKLLNSANKRILVVIDDIDRLNNEQIRQIFQLISAVAKFPNTIYLIAFDKNVVVKALEKVQEGRGEDYLRKIIQIPIQLPEVQHQQLESILFGELDKILENNPEITFYNEQWNRVYEACVRPFINSIRDINRLCNTLEFKLANIASEIDFADMVALTSIEIKEPGIYEWIKVNKGKLVGIYDPTLSSKDVNSRSNMYRDEIKQTIGFDTTEPKEIDHRTQICITALSKLFPSFETAILGYGVSHSPTVSRKHNLLCHADKFDRYFNLDIDGVKVKKEQIKRILFTEDINEIIENIKMLDAAQCSLELLDEIEANLDEISDERARILIEGLLKSVDTLNDKDSYWSIWRDAKQKAQRLAYLLFANVEEKNRMGIILNLIDNVTADTIEAISVFLNMMELGYGRLAANGDERKEYKHIISLDQLFEIERKFVEKCRSIFCDKSLFELKTWIMTLYVWGDLDKDYFEKYLSDKMKDDRNVIIYLRTIVGEWHSPKTIDYQIQKEPYKFITKQRINEAIDSMVANKELFKMDIDILRRAVAVLLSYQGEADSEGYINQTLVDKWIEKNK